MEAGQEMMCSTCSYSVYPRSPQRVLYPRLSTLGTSSRYLLPVKCLTPVSLLCRSLPAPAMIRSGEWFSQVLSRSCSTWYQVCSAIYSILDCLDSLLQFRCPHGGRQPPSQRMERAPPADDPPRSQAGGGAAGTQTCTGWPLLQCSSTRLTCTFCHGDQ